MNKTDYVPIDIAMKLKDLGFRDNSLHFYNENGEFDGYSSVLPDMNYGCDDKCNAPMISQAMRWLRDTHNIAVTVDYMPNTWLFKVQDIGVSVRFETISRAMYGSYEDAAVAGIDIATDLLGII